MPRFRDPFEEKERLERREKREREQEKKSWREIDAQRDRGFYDTSSSGPAKPNFEIKRDDSEAKKALDNLFQGKKSKAQEAAWKKVAAARGTDFSKQASAYVEKHGIPRAWDDLLRLLDHDEETFVNDILERMTILAPQETALRRDVFLGKLRVMKMTVEDPTIISKIETCEQQISAMD